MEPFLEKLAKHVVANSEKLEDVAIVLPSKRGKTFFKAYLGQQLSRPAWAPQLYSIDEFMEELSGLKKADPMHIMLEFYSMYSRTSGVEPDFKDFCSWGGVMLQDMNEIDSYMVNGKELFDYLSEARALQLWNPGEEKLTEFQLKYLDFWRSIGHYYEEFRIHLLQKGYGYAGLIFRTAAERLKADPSSLKWSKVIFAGFNALTPAETDIISTLKKAGKCELAWDADEYYLNDENQEAGKFLRRLLDRKKDNAAQWISKDLLEGKKEIKIISVSQNTAQTRVAGQLITDVLREGKASETGLVLADESLLLPMLENLPAAVTALNITMGYPFKASPVYNFIHSVLELHFRNKTEKTKKEKNFYYRNVRELLGNPVTSFLLKTEKEKRAVQTLIQTFDKANRLFISASEMRFLDGSVAKLFSESTDPKLLLYDLCSCFEEVIVRVKEEGTINGEFVLAGLKMLRKVSEFCGMPGVDASGLLYLFQTFSSAHTIPFFGEAVRGMQMMGILETRTLDFKNIILLSANEGILPSTSRQNSFVPIEIKRLFKLPTYAERDAVFAYHFYRMIQRAENVWIVYTSSVSENGPGEKSRYVAQLQHELPKSNPSVVIDELTLTFKAEQKEINGVNIKKNQEILDVIERKLRKGISPSAFNTWKDCNYRFYLRYVAGIEESGGVEDSIDAATFGSLVHKVLEEFYTPFVGKTIDEKAISRMMSEVEKKSEAVFLGEMKENDLKQGKNLLAFRVAIRFIKNFLAKEKEHIKSKGPLRIHGLEEKLAATLDIKGIPVLISGYTDRIDETDGVLRIIDYKTGSVESSELKIKDLGDLAVNRNTNKSLQLMIYAWLLSQDPRHQEKMIKSGIFALKKSSTGLNSVQFDGSDRLNKEVLEQFQKVLEELISEMLDPEKPIGQTEDEKVCGYCSYAGICGK